MSRPDSKTQPTTVATTTATTPNARHWPILEMGYAPATTKKYKKAVYDFCIWCISTGQDPTTLASLDELLADYFHFLFDERDGGGRSIAVCVLMGIRMLDPRCRPDSALPIATAILERWAKAIEPVSYPPMSWELAVLVAVQLARAGHFLFAVGVVLAHDCLLRIGELMAMRRDSIADVGDVRLGAELKVMTVSIGKAKTGKNQSVTVANPAVAELVRAVVANTKPGQLLFPGGPTKFRAAFKASCASLGLSKDFVPHSLRHGGATRLSMQGARVEDILLRGRWRSNASARTYIQSGAAVAISLAVPEPLKALASSLSRDVVLSLACALAESAGVALPQKH